MFKMVSRSQSVSGMVNYARLSLLIAVVPAYVPIMTHKLQMWDFSSSLRRKGKCLILYRNRIGMWKTQWLFIAKVFLSFPFSLLRSIRREQNFVLFEFIHFHLNIITPQIIRLCPLSLLCPCVNPLVESSE